MSSVFTSWTWVIHLDLALTLNLAFMQVNKISKYNMYFELPQIYYSNNILLLLNTNVFPEKKNPCISPNVIHWGFSCYAQWFKTNIFWWSWSWQHHSAHARGIKMSWFMTGMSNRKQTNIYNSKPHKCAVT